MSDLGSMYEVIDSNLIATNIPKKKKDKQRGKNHDFTFHSIGFYFDSHPSQYPIIHETKVEITREPQ